MENVVHCCGCGLGEVSMSEFYYVIYLGRSGGFCHNCVTLVVLKRYTNIPAICAAEVLLVSCPSLFVCNYVTSKWSDWCSVVIERAVEL